MTSIIKYKIVSDNLTTHRLKEPDTLDGPKCTELCTLDGLTYVSVPDGVTLPEDQPETAKNSLESVTLDGELREKIKAASPHCQLIADRVIERIRAKYTADDELFYARILLGEQMGRYTMSPAEKAEVDAFIHHVEATREWGRQQRAEIGL